jgi:dienelactone hydrolase
MSRFFTFILLTCALLHAEEPRTFTAADGRTLKATIVSKTDTHVIIRRAEDEQDFLMPLERLSAADQAFVKAWGKAPAAALPAPATSPGGKDEAKQALDDARKFTAAGEYAKALERHEWFHANALKITPSMLGVRLSFALSDWVRLGQQYPPAIEALKRIRDDNASALISGAGNRALFQDLASINRELAKVDPAALSSTVETFKQMDAKVPALAKECFERAEEYLVIAGETEAFQKQAGDLKAWLAGRLQKHQSTIARYQQMGEDRMIIYYENKLRPVVAFVVEVARSKGDVAQAEELKAMAAKVLGAAPANASVDQFPFKSLQLDAQDALKVEADFYDVGDKAKPIILYCHRAGSSRGEYRIIASKLARMGFNGLALDQRSGEEFDGVRNETYKRADERYQEKKPGKHPVFIYDAARPDIVAGLDWIKAQGFTGPLIFWGSSYSASYSIIFAAERPEIKAVVAFAPGEWLMKESAVEAAKKMSQPILVIHPENEKNKGQPVFDSIASPLKQLIMHADILHGSNELLRGVKRDETWKVVLDFLQPFTPKP